MGEQPTDEGWIFIRRRPCAIRRATPDLVRRSISSLHPPGALLRPAGAPLRPAGGDLSSGERPCKCARRTRRGIRRIGRRCRVAKFAFAPSYCIAALGGRLRDSPASCCCVSTSLPRRAPHPELGGPTMRARDVACEFLELVGWVGASERGLRRCIAAARVRPTGREAPESLHRALLRLGGGGSSVPVHWQRGPGARGCRGGSTGACARPWPLRSGATDED